EQPIRRKVALKIIKLGMDTKQVIARFEAERQALAMMDHANIAKVLDAGATETGRPYFVMELVKGVSITEYCDANELSTRERLDLFLQVCNAVQHAHQKGIIHRDLKPSNVMVTQRDGKPVPKVIDFGIAKATNQRLTEKTLFTRYAHIIGTPAYMSPEQAELSSAEVDARTDVYSLGVLLYELLTGTTPFGEERLRKAGYVQMQRIICEEEPTRPSSKLGTSDVALVDAAKHRGTTPSLLRRLLRRDLDWIVMKCLEKDRTRRYRTAAGLAADVQRHLNHEPVQAVAPSVSYRLRKFARRNRTVVVTVALVTAATLMGATVAKFAGWTSPGSMGKDEHAPGMVMRHVWNAPPMCNLSGTLSRDGRYLSYIDWNAGNAAVYDVATETSWMVTGNTDPTWTDIEGWAEQSVSSPDGEQVAYSWYNEKGVDYYDLRIVNRDGTDARVLYHDPQTFYVIPYAWSPDGEHVLAYFSDAEKNLVDERTGQRFRKGYLVLVAVADGSVRILKTWQQRSSPSVAVFSPDGRHVAYDFGQKGALDRHDICLLALDDGRDGVLVDHLADDRLFGWTPDGTKILFSSDRTANRGLWMIEVSDGMAQGPARLLKDEFDGRPVGFIADGSYYYSVSTRANNVCLAKLNSTGTVFEGRPGLVSSLFVGSTGLGDWSPDGRFLAYRTPLMGPAATALAAETWAIVVYSVETSQERLVVPSVVLRPSTRMKGPWWSPDGRLLLVYGMGPETGFGLYTVDAITGETTLVPWGQDIHFGEAAWSPDSESIYVRWGRIGCKISRVDLATGEEVLVYEGEGAQLTFDVSPDGQWFAFYQGKDSLVVMPSEGGQPREVLRGSEGEIVPAFAFVRWTPDGEHLLFGKRMTELWMVNVQTGQQQRIGPAGGNLRRAVMHPDGQSIAFMVEQPGSELWVLENFLPEQ
ncbi:MAG: protein kinase, partial [Phycisphaerales bacterium]